MERPRLLDGIQAVFFDMFDTLVEQDPSGIPVIHQDGTDFPTTAGILYEEIRSHRKGLSFEDFFEHLDRITTEFWDEKEELDREISAPVRFERLIRHCGLAPEPQVVPLAEHLARVHMQAVMNSTRPVRGARDVLERVRSLGLPVALISNFDYAPAAHAILERAGLGHFFDKRVISDDIGFRKPNPRLFSEALDHFGVPPESALHVGDDPRADAWGAGAIGIRTVWIDRKNLTYQEEEHAPTVRIEMLSDLLDFLS